MIQSISRASAAAFSKNAGFLSVSAAGFRFSTVPFGGRDKDEDLLSKDAVRNEPMNTAQNDAASQANPDMQSQTGDLAQPTASEAAREEEEYQTPDVLDRPADMPEGTGRSARGFDQLGKPGSESQTKGEGLVNRGPGTSSGTSGAL